MAKQVIPTKMPRESLITEPALLGAVIKAKRTAIRMKLSDCATLCGIGINTLSRIENGNPNSTLGSVFSVLKGLGIKLSTLEQIDKPAIKNDWV
ncbi:MAG: transcriptional regulator with XRE-family HTH domain [Paraglaciecola sp.]|jgi:transcriptional regulator with XRE-family HTH domain